MESRVGTVILTGANGLLASACIKSLAGEGFACFGQYRQENSRIESVKTEFAKQKVFLINSALDSEEAVCSLFEQVGAICKEQGIDTPSILINTAGAFEKTNLADVEFDNAMQMLAINTVTPLIMAKYFVKMFRENSLGTPGKIINFADICAVRPWANYSVYSASRAALAAVTKSLAKELAPDFTVNAVAPGMIGPNERMGADELEKQLKMIPMKRLGNVREIVSVVSLLIANNYITGQVLCVDGGRSI